MIPDYRTAMAAGQDAGNRSMVAAGRVAWDEEDFNAAAAVTLRLLGLEPAEEGTEDKP
jgi:hypothetical protein